MFDKNIFYIADNTKLKYMGDLQASERLKNHTLCIMENGQIRNIKSDELLNDKIIVQVDNWERVDQESEYIEKGEYVRYTTI